MIRRGAPNNGLGTVRWGDGSSTTTNLRRVYQSLGSKTITYTDPFGQSAATTVQVSCFNDDDPLLVPSGALAHQICP